MQNDQSIVAYKDRRHIVSTKAPGYQLPVVHVSVSVFLVIPVYWPLHAGICTPRLVSGILLRRKIGQKMLIPFKPFVYRTVTPTLWTITAGSLSPAFNASKTFRLPGSGSLYRSRSSRPAVAAHWANCGDSCTLSGFFLYGGTLEQYPSRLYLQSPQLHNFCILYNFQNLQRINSHSRKTGKV